MLKDCIDYLEGNITKEQLLQVMNESSFDNKNFTNFLLGHFGFGFVFQEDGTITDVVRIRPEE